MNRWVASDATVFLDQIRDNKELRVLLYPVKGLNLVLAHEFMDAGCTFLEWISVL